MKTINLSHCWLQGLRQTDRGIEITFSAERGTPSPEPRDRTNVRLFVCESIISRLVRLMIAEHQKEIARAEDELRWFRKQVERAASGDL